MTKLKYLEKCKDMAYHNLFCYSNNLNMTVPKKGYEDEWNKAKEECKIVEELINIVDGKPDAPVIGSAVIDGKVVHKWDKVIKAVEKVAEL